MKIFKIYHLLLIILFTVNSFAADKSITGTVKKLINQSGYTYIQLSNKSWAATNTINLKVGQKIKIINPEGMKNFYSKSLKKTFKHIMFTSTVLIKAPNGKYLNPNKTYKGHPTVKKEEQVVKVKKGDVKKIKGGYTIAELDKQRKKLVGKTIKFSAVVTKVIPNIKGKVWAHVSDGTGSLKKDLVVVFKQMVKIGQKIKVKGKLKTDISFGHGYYYPIMVQEAKLIK